MTRGRYVKPLLNHLAQGIRRHTKRNRVSTHQRTTSNSLVQRSIPLSHVLPRRDRHFIRLSREPMILHPLPRTMNRRNNIVTHHHGLRNRQITLPKTSVIMTTTQRRRRREPLLRNKRNVRQHPRKGHRRTSTYGFRLCLLRPSSSLWANLSFQPVVQL